MSNSVSRARLWALLGLLAYAPLAATQTLELVHGQGRFVDIPGLTVGLQPGSIAAAPDGYVYVTDINGKFMRLNAATGTVTALPATPGGLSHNVGFNEGITVDAAGIPHIATQGSLNRVNADGTFTSVGAMQYSGPMAFGLDGTIYSTPGDSRLYARAPSGAISVVAGGEEPGFGGDGGPASSALLNAPQGIAVGPGGDIYIADTSNNRIRRISAVTGIIATFAGTGAEGFNGNGLHATQTNIYQPYGIGFDGAGNLYVSSQYGGRILRIDADSQLVTTVGGGGSGDDGGPAIGAYIAPRLLTVDGSGNIFFSDWTLSYQYIRKIDAATGIISRVLGFNSFYFCGEAVPANYSCLAQPLGLDVTPNGDLLISTTALSRIRHISATSGYITTWANTTESPIGIEHDAAGNIYVASYGGYQVNRYDAVTRAKTKVAGGNGYGLSGDGGPATAASLAAPNDVALDAAGNLFISDGGNNRVRRVDAATGIITTYALISNPNMIEFDAAGNLVVSGGCSLRKIDTNTGAITTIAGTGSCTHGEVAGGGLATATTLGGSVFAIGPDGNIFLGWASHIYRIDAATGIITRVPAPPAGLTTPEGVSITQPNRMEFDAAGRLYVSQDGTRDYIFRVSGLLDSTPPVVTANVSGIAGNAGWYRGDVQVSWSVDDAESAISSTSGCTSTTVTADTTGIEFTCTATSRGGTTTQSVTVRKDATPPSANITYPAQGATYGAFTSVNAQYTCSDAHSAVTCVGSLANGAGLPTNIAGAKTFAVTATDAAGNTATLSQSYAVAAMVFERFIEPLRRSPTYNGITAGNLIPIRWRLLDGAGGIVSNPASFQSLTALTFGCQTAVPLNATATGGPGLSHNPATGVFTYNWQTDASWTGCRRVQLRFGNNSMSELIFRFQ